MPGILFGHPLTGEDMAEVAPAIGTDDLNPSAITICMLFYRSGKLIIKTRPPASRGKLICGDVERLIALPADVGAWHFIIVILAGKGPFRAFMEDDTGFVSGKWIVGHSLWFSDYQ
jgi:hypothetical protein